LWSGKYLEIDNFIVHPEHRSKGVGKLLTDFVHQKALDLGCNNIVLDAYTNNFQAHRFYYNQGYGPKGFHFVKILDEEGLT
jgi:GNAT superfamily N-acetyltransferase